MIIDMHVHLADKRIYPDYWLDSLKDNIVRSVMKENGVSVGDELLSSMMEGSLNDYDCLKIISQMDKAGIRKSVVLLADLGYNRDDIELDIEELFNIHHRAVSRYPERLAVFGGVDPRRGKKGIELFEKGIKEYGFCGLKIYPPCGFEIDDRSLYPLYEICNYYGLPVQVHIGPSLPSMKTSFNYPGSVLRVTGEFKHIPFILGHAALVYFEESRELPSKREMIFLETSGFQKIYHNKGLLSERIKYLMRTCPDNLVFGTDWPLFGYQKQWVKYFEEMDTITESQKEKLFFKNAQTVFSMRRKQAV